MPSLCADRRGLAVCRDSLLFFRQAAGRLDRRAEHDWLAGRDSTEHSAVAVRFGGDAPRVRRGRVSSDEQIVVLTAAHRRAAEANSILDAEHGRKTEEGFGQVRFDFVKDRFAEARGNATRHNLRRSTDRVLIFADFFDELNHLLRGVQVRAADDVGLTIGKLLDLLERHGSRIGNRRVDAADLADIADNLGSE